MKSLLFTGYILAWPVISLAVLVLIVTVTIKEFRTAREEGHDVI